jgi:hypothetical protein
MGMQQAPRPKRSPWVRYAPFIAILVIVAIVAVVLVAIGGDDEDDSNDSVAISGQSGQNGIPLFYNDAKASGQLDSHTWQDNCDTETGRVAIPVTNPAHCVPKFTGDNGGATAPGVTADSIRIGYYVAKADPIGDALLKMAGAYDEPANTAKAYQNYAEIFNARYEFYGRKIEMVPVEGTGTLADAIAARADAGRAAADNLFAVLGGPAQAREFGDELAKRKVMCVASCIIAQPQKVILENSPYLWPTGPTPDQSVEMVAEFIQKQLVGKNAEYAGGEQKGKPRTFTLLTYNTPDGQYTPSWDLLEKRVGEVGADIVEHVDYYLNLPSLQADARTIAAKLKAANATSLVFTGDPIFPRYLTTEMTALNYFPEWVMAGTVLADTNVFGRTFDQRQWEHAFGLQLAPARLPKEKQDSYTLHQWWFGTPPPTDNNYGIVQGNIEFLAAGLQLAGPNLTPESFKAGIYAAPPPESPDTPTISTILSWGTHGFWPTMEDPGGLDNSGVMYWDPEAEGTDETGAEGKGMYRVLDGGRRYVNTRWPTEPLKLFDPAGTVTIYDAADVPPELLPKDYPAPPEAPASQ